MSKLPVGSSAKIIWGSLIIALAIATLWHSPPESWEGKWFNRFESPTFFNNFTALDNANFLSFLRDKEAK